MIGKFCTILCGIAATWACIAVGLFMFRALTRPMCTFSPARRARLQVRDVEQALVQYAIENNRCPWDKNELISGRYVRSAHLVDPWGTAVAYSCSPDDELNVSVTSAGPDRIFGTADDVTAEQ